MRDRVAGWRHSEQIGHVAEAEPLERWQVEAAARLCEVRERVRAGVAVVGGVGQRPDAAGIEHDYEGATPRLHRDVLAGPLGPPVMTPRDARIPAAHGR